MNYYRLEPEGKQVPSRKSASSCSGKLLSMDEAMRQHDRLVHAYIQRQGGGDLSYEDALQAGRIGLWCAIRGYDPQRGFAFSTYAWVAIARAIYRANKKDQVLPHDNLSAASEWAYTLDLEGWMDQILIHQALYALLCRLPQRQRRIIVARYGLAGTPIRLLGDLGAELGLSGERVRQLQQEALAWLRHPARSVHLRLLTDRNSIRDYRQALRLNADWQGKRRGQT